MLHDQPHIINCDFCGTHLATDSRIVFRTGFTFCKPCLETNSQLRELAETAKESNDFDSQLRLGAFVRKHRTPSS